MADLGWMANFEVKDAGDATDLVELVCTKCNEQVCALQAPDTMLMLVLRIGEHVCPKMHDHSITVDCHPECPRWEYVNERSEMPETAQTDFAGCRAAGGHLPSARHSKHECPYYGKKD